MQKANSLAAHVSLPPRLELARCVCECVHAQRPCNLRVAADGVHAVVPALEGPVGILNESNALVSLVDVAGLLGDKGHLHPHDALLMPSGDLIVATWNPGKLSYWKRI